MKGICIYFCNRSENILKIIPGSAFLLPYVILFVGNQNMNIFYFILKTNTIYYYDFFVFYLRFTFKNISNLVLKLWSDCSE